MTEVSVEEFAKQVRTEPDRLLQQLQKAGIAVTSIQDSITLKQRQQLLSYLQQSRAQAKTGAKNASSTITLKNKPDARAKINPLKSGVNIAFRKKKSHVIPTIITTESPSEGTTDPSTITPSLPTDQVGQDIARKSPPANRSDASNIDSAANTKVDEAAATLKQNESTRAIGDAAQPEPPKHKKRHTLRSPGRKSGNVEQKFEGGDKLYSQSGKRNSLKQPASSQTQTASLQHEFAKPVTPVIREVGIAESISVAELAEKMSVKATEVLKVMMKMGAVVTINQVIDQETASIVVEEMGHKPKLLSESADIELAVETEAQDYSPVARAPVVTIMGHVDHGKTSLLDYIRRTKVTSTEAGGITQHIGAYHVETKKGMLTFLDTPGHEAFTMMRARGAKCTDIVVLIVAADDGVMPQTIEAIQHANAAEVPIIVAINKMDKPGADPDKIKHALSQHNLIPEDWGGDTMIHPISAITGEGVDTLIEGILLQAEMMELAAVNQGRAQGVVIESRLDRQRGPVATILVVSGELRKGDILLVGREYGRVRAMVDDGGKTCQKAGPSMPVEVLGLSGTPSSGDDAIVMPNEQRAREISQFRKGKYREVHLARKKVVKLENVFSQLDQGKQRVLTIVLKADVQGSLEAITQALEKLSTEEVRVNIVASGVGGITESDANLALVSNAVVIGFNVRADVIAKKVIEREGLDLHYYGVIYDLIDEVKKALSGLLAPEFQEKIVGLAEVREVFRASKWGSIAGCMVIDGMIRRSLPIRVLRDNVVVFEGQLESLRRFKEDVPEVRNGMECGIGVKDYNDIKPGDQIEVYETVQVKREIK